MSINAQDIVEQIGNGAAEALNTNKLFLGIEEDEFNNADIHPEYVTTVEVAKKFTAPDRYVSLETHMKELREQARMLARLRQKDKVEWAKIDSVLAPYKFGKKDSQRLDILVRSSDVTKLPLLIAEAKLGVDNVPGVILDIERVVRLLTMYQDLKLLDSHVVYGAVLFHSMDEGNDTGSMSQKATDLLAEINTHLKGVTGAKSWLKAKAGLLTHGSKVQPITGYREYYPDEKMENIFAKDSFSFAPGLVLLGNASDVTAVKL